MYVGEAWHVWPRGRKAPCWARGARPPSDWSDREVDRQGDGARQAYTHAEWLAEDRSEMHEPRTCRMNLGRARLGDV